MGVDSGLDERVAARWKGTGPTASNVGPLAFRLAATPCNGGPLAFRLAATPCNGKYFGHHPHRPKRQKCGPPAKPNAKRPGIPKTSECLAGSRVVDSKLEAERLTGSRVSLPPAC